LLPFLFEVKLRKKLVDFFKSFFLDTRTSFVVLRDDMSQEILIVLIANLAVRVHRVRHRFVDVLVVTYLDIAVVL
jgi:hypothetical protein